MSDNPPPNFIGEHALEIYQGDMAKHNLSARAAELVSVVETLQDKLGSLRENIVSSLVIPVHSLYICADIRYYQATRKPEIG